MDQLAYLGFRLIHPHSLLRPYVGDYWSLRREIALPVYHEEYMHPSGGFGIVFNFGDQVYLDTLPITTPVFLDGANTRSRRVGFLGHVEMLGIRFHEGGAFPFLGMPLIELQDEPDMVEPRISASLLDLYDRLRATTTFSARICLIESWLMQRLIGGATLSALIPASLKMLREEIALLRHGNRMSSIATLANDLAISPRQLEHLYRNQVGIAPLQYLRLQRVQLARLALIQKKQSNARLAAALGFYDQPHFIREFRSVIGVTPHAYMRRKHGDSAAD
jgi:AraC-like DNA-binding protein